MSKPLVLMGPRQHHDAALVVYKRLLDRTVLAHLTMGVLVDQEQVHAQEVLRSMVSTSPVDTFIGFGDLVDQCFDISPDVLDPVLTLAAWQMTPIKVIALPELTNRCWEMYGYYQHVVKVITWTHEHEISDLTQMLGTRLN